MKTNIRRAKPDDLSFLLQLENDAFPSYQQSSMQNLRRGIISPFQDIFIIEIGSRKKEKAGATILFKYKHTLRIYSIALLNKFQNKGLGDYMMSNIKEYARQNRFQRIVLEVSVQNGRLIDWYKARGFEYRDVLKDYYDYDRDALKMEFKVDVQKPGKKTNNVIVINQPFKWKDAEVNATVITVRDYLNNPLYQNSSDYRIFNLCSSYRYQSYGYYVSMLASARGQRVVPSITTIRDFRMLNVVQSAAYEIDELINRLLGKCTESSFSLNIYFGQTRERGFKSLAMKLYQLFEAPLFKVNFIKHDKWLIKDIKILTLRNLPSEDTEYMYRFAKSYFNRKRHHFPKLTNYKYDLAILVNPQEENPPSNAEALSKFKKIANDKGLYVEYITKSDIDKINEFDALFIRETTNVNHHTYEMSRLAYAEGLVVIDDPWSILRCSNKIYQNELFKKHHINTPTTTVLTKNLFQPKQLNTLNYPMVLKQPDSAFSLGVIKVESKEEALIELTKLFNKSDMVICQEFMYSEFDWRIGILDNKPIFACKYYMSGTHWQIYDWNSDKEDKAGDSETLPLTAVPEVVLKTAVKAASLIGDGLYGVDLKQVKQQVYVVEVNDNPNIDAGVEDLVLNDLLYEQVVDSIINRIEVAKNIRKISFCK